MEGLDIENMIKEVNHEVEQLLESDNNEMGGIDKEIQAEVDSALKETQTDYGK